MPGRPTKLLLVDQTSFVSLLPKMGRRSPHIDHWYVEQRLRQLDELFFLPALAAAARTGIGLAARGAAAAGRTAGQAAARTGQAAGRAVTRGTQAAGQAALKAGQSAAQAAGQTVARGGQAALKAGQSAAQTAGQTAARAGQSAAQAAGQTAARGGQAALKAGQSAGQAAGKVGAGAAKDTAQIAGKVAGKGPSSWAQRLGDFRSSEKGQAFEKRAREGLKRFRQSNIGKKIEKKATDFGKKVTDAAGGQPVDPIGNPPGGGGPDDPFSAIDASGDGPQTPTADTTDDLGRRATGPLSGEAPAPSLAPPDPGPLARPERPQSAGDELAPPPSAAGDVQEAPAAEGPPSSEPSGPPPAPDAGAPAPVKSNIKQVNVGADETCPAPKNKSSVFGAAPGQKRCHDQTPGRRH